MHGSRNSRHSKNARKRTVARYPARGSGARTSSARAGGTRRKRKYRLNKRWPLVVAAICALLIVAGIIWGVVALFTPRSAASDKIASGVTIDGVKVAGMTRQEATDAVQQANREKWQRQRVTLRYEGDSWQYTVAQLGARDDAAAVVEKALLVGQGESGFDVFKSWFNVDKSGRALTTTLDFDVEQMRAGMQEICEKIEVAVVENSANFDAAAADESKRFTFTEGKDGLAIDTDALIVALRQDLKDGDQADVTLSLKTVQPQFSMDAIRASTAKVSEASTTLQGYSQARRGNIAKAFEKLSGQVVAPGETLSFNTLTGKRDEAAGYQAVREVTADNVEADVMAGGASQAATTLYNAALKADMEITARSAHAIPPDFVGRGLDAYVDDAANDLVIKNSTAYPIYIRAYLGDAAAHVEIYGAPLADGQSVRLDTETLQTIAKPEVETIQDVDKKYVTYTDETKDVSTSREGYVVSTFKTYLDKDGKQIKRDLIVKHTYEAMAGKRYVGVTTRQGGDATQPTPTPTPSDQHYTQPEPNTGMGGMRPSAGQDDDDQMYTNTADGEFAN
nr:VanW family protein [Maliibacterium massiliense]